MEKYCPCSQLAAALQGWALPPGQGNNTHVPLYWGYVGIELTCQGFGSRGLQWPLWAEPTAVVESSCPPGSGCNAPGSQSRSLDAPGAALSPRRAQPLAAQLCRCCATLRCFISNTTISAVLSITASHSTTVCLLRNRKELTESQESESPL